MAANVATALEIEGAGQVRPVSWPDWLGLPIRDRDLAVSTVRGPVRVPTVIVAVNFSRVPKKRPRLNAVNVRLRDGGRCQYTGRELGPNEGNLDHIIPRSKGGASTWENLVWASKEVNARKGDRLPHEAGLKLLKVPKAPKELPVTAVLRNLAGIPDWKLFLAE